MNFRNAVRRFRAGSSHFGIMNFAKRLHRDESGSISIATVFAFIFLTMVLGMVMNVGRHVDRKVKIQNAADASTYTGATVMARSMNTLAFTNHLMCDVFALTAYLREARDRDSESMTPEILARWDEMAEQFRDAPQRKFTQLADAIPIKTPMEAALILEFSNQNSIVSERLLPVMEQILEYEMIPEFQRALVIATPGLATEAANEIAGRHGPEDRGLYGELPMMAMMWQTNGQPFGALRESGLSQLPVSDPIFDPTGIQPTYFRLGVIQRKRMSERYLAMLNQEMLRDIDRVAKMSQFGNLWRGFTQAQLKYLLEVEYPNRNIPYQIRRSSASSGNQAIEEDFMFVGVTYWKPMAERMPGAFANPIDGDDLGFAQAQMYIPRTRLILDLREPPEDQIYRVGGPLHRDLMNQNWTAQLVPATTAATPMILQTSPSGSRFDPPSLGGITVDDFRRINTH